MASAVDLPKSFKTLPALPKLQAMYPAPAYARPSLLASSPYCNSQTRPAPPTVELYPVDLATWDDGVWGDRLFMESQPDELDEPWPYRFKSGDTVWLCDSNGEWCRGKVVSQAKQGKTRSEDLALFWCVEFYVTRVKVRKWLAPLNGDIKPDTEHTHRLLWNAGWLESDSDQ